MSGLLRKRKFSLKSNRKGQTGPPHPDRNKQFQNIEQNRAQFTDAGLPVISVDAKKKELVGNFKNAGVAWRQKPEGVIPGMTLSAMRNAGLRLTPFTT